MKKYGALIPLAWLFPILMSAMVLPGHAAGGTPRLLVELPPPCNTPDGCTLSRAGDLILSVPNFNNKALMQAGVIDKEAPATMLCIDKENKVSTWYDFKGKDLHPETGKVGPMGCAFGPDGHLYLADNQFFFNGANKSRLLRVRCENGKPVGCEVVVEGFIVANAVVWHGDRVFVSETILAPIPKETPGMGKAPLYSGTYGFHIDEFKNGPVKLSAWRADKPDAHLIATYASSGRVGFGADGLTVDGAGNLYCGIFEDGVVYKTSFDGTGKVLTTRVFASDHQMACCDGIFWNKADNRIYVADMLNNAVQAVDMSGKVSTLHKNGDTTGADGLLDQPCEVHVRGDELIVVNMDMPWESDLLANKKIDKPYTVSVIKLK